MKTSTRYASSGSSLILTLVVVALLSLVSANVLLTVLPHLQTRAQTSSWQEAILAADAGADMALGELTRNATDLTVADWTAAGWQLKIDRPPGTPGSSGPAVPAGWPQPLPPGGPTELRHSATILLDNLRLDSHSAESTQVDVQLTAYWPELASPPWFRIRAVGTAHIPGDQAPAAHASDTHLRKINLHTIRHSIQGDDNRAQTVPLPNVSRTIELLVRPVPRFALTLAARARLLLPASGQWQINSETTDGPRPAWLGKATIGSAAAPAAPPPVALFWPTNSAFPPLNGDLALHAADPATVAGLPPATDPWRSHYTLLTGFDADPRPAQIPHMENPEPISRIAAASEVQFLADRQRRSYRVDGDLGDFSVVPAIAGQPGSVCIHVLGDLRPRRVTLGAGVTASLYIGGRTIDLSGGAINATGTAPQLRIYGCHESEQFPDPGIENQREIRLSGEQPLHALLYAPFYDLRSVAAGQAIWRTAIVAFSIDLSLGGPQTLLYPEVLLSDNETARYEIVRYIEDNRK